MLWVRIEKHLLSKDIVMLTRGGCLYFNYSIWFLFFTTLRSLWDLSFPSRDHTHALCSGSLDS